MKQNLLNVCLFISSFVPLYVLVVVKTVIEIINGNLNFNVINSILIVLMLALIIIGIVGVYYLIRYEDKKSEEIVIMEYTDTTDKHFLGYFSLFVLFALTFDLSKVSMTVVYLVILVLIGVVYVRNSLYTINPLLNIIGYSFYEVVYRNSKGEEHKAKMFFKGRLNLARYKVAFEKNGLCFVINQVVKKKE